MRLLLDTHILVWSLTEPTRLSGTTRAKIEDDSNTILFSPVSIWEIAIKSALAKSDFVYDPSLILSGALAASFVEMCITSKAAMMAGALPAIHRDPFDRMLIAQTLQDGGIILTADKLLTGYSDHVELV